VSQRAERILRCQLECEVRGIDEEKRQATFVAATERAVAVSPWGPPEVLRMKGARLKRYKRNPVVLDSHRRSSVEDVIGSATVTVQGRELHAVITYDEDERSERVWKKVRAGSVRAISIGYVVNRAKVRRLREGEHDGAGDARVEGPADIANEWELLEVSNVAIGADEDALRRSFYDEIHHHEEGRMSSINYGAGVTGAPELGAPLGTPGERTSPLPTPPANPPVIPAPPSGPAPSSSAPGVQLAPAAVDALSRAAMREAHKREVLAITPRGLENVAERAIAQGLDFEATRKVLLEEQAKRFAPLGTPEPVAPTAPPQRGGAAQPPAAPAVREITPEVLLRSFESLND